MTATSPPNTDTYDTIVIGAGPGGYVAAIRAAQLGQKVACVEQRATLGGTCLNVGCIPSKALLTSSEKLVEARDHLAKHGVRITEVQLDLAAMMRHKEQVVTDNVRGLDYLMTKNKITTIRGRAKIVAPGHIEVTNEQDPRQLTCQNVIIATGSTPTPLADVAVDEESILSSTGALSLDQVPSRLAVIGGGYIGLELGSIWSRLGAQVVVIEFLDRILAGTDREVARQMHGILVKQGLEFRLETKVNGARVADGQVVLETESAKGGGQQESRFDKVLVAIGRRPNTEGLGLEGLGVAVNDRGQIITDHRFATNVGGVYAIGDVIAGPMLAHKAEDEGVAVAEILAGQAGHVNYEVIPSVVYTAPEVAQVGATEEQLQGRSYVVGRFPFSANGRARALNHTEGMVKLLADRQTDRLLGAHIIGPDAGTLIAEIALAMEFSASAEDIARTCHAHPTLNEAVKEAALAVAGRTIHL